MSINCRQSDKLYALMRGTTAPPAIKRALEEIYVILDLACDPNVFVPPQPWAVLNPLIDALIVEGILR